MLLVDQRQPPVRRIKRQRLCIRNRLRIRLTRCFLMIMGFHLAVIFQQIIQRISLNLRILMLRHYPCFIQKHFLRRCYRLNNCQRNIRRLHYGAVSLLHAGKSGTLRKHGKGEAATAHKKGSYKHHTGITFSVCGKMPSGIIK